MIGNVIQSKYLVVRDYPTAAALSFVMLAIILILVIVYIRFAGTRGADGRGGRTLSALEVAARARAQYLRGAGDRLHADPDRDDRAVLLQRSGRQATTSPGRASRSSTGRTPFAIRELTDALITSLELAAVATVISTALGTLIAMALVRYQFFGRKAANFLIVIPMATPEVVIGAALLSMFLLPFVEFVSLGFATPGDRPRDVLDQLRRHRRALAADRLRPLARGGRPRPRRRRLHDLPHRHPAAARARRSSPPRCSPSRSRSTTS